MFFSDHSQRFVCVLLVTITPVHVGENFLTRVALLYVVCKRGSVEFTDTVRQRGLASSLRHERGDGYFVLHICFADADYFYYIYHIRNYQRVT